MLKLNYEDIVRKIKEEKGLSDDEINERVSSKVKQLSYLISKEGAVHIIANELGIKVYSNIFKKRYKVNELMAELRSVEIVLKVLQKYEIREFKNEKRAGRLATLFVGDETGSCRLVIWEEGIINTYFNDLKEGDVIKILNAYVRENNGYKELHLGGNSAFVLNPENEAIGDVSKQQPRASYRKKSIDKIEANDFIEVVGTIVQIFGPRFYIGCPECYKKIDEKSNCSEHGLVKEKALPILNFVLDDGTDSIRISLFRDNVEKLLNLSYDEILKMKDDPGLFENLKGALLGKQVAAAGRANKNAMFDTIELNASSIREVNAMELINEMIPR